ncbi:sle1_043 (plasmid) [Streptomyces leeuwenhoekii]|uniref:Sle1_043 protein n=1 Tax=Streptomyces leeuwenhoekii TaxID=1437453 RepID=A0A0F7VL00_STRLW|nr:sle1_043 [Streptomyces leeuwenhoekii]
MRTAYTAVYAEGLTPAPRRREPAPLKVYRGIRPLR